MNVVADMQISYAFHKVSDLLVGMLVGPLFISGHEMMTRVRRASNGKRLSFHTLSRELPD